MAQWLERGRRKPLVLRGASQVGKTWPVRELARRAGLELVELNFEEQLVSFLSTATTEQPSVPVHDKLMRLYREYTVVGGMPDAVMEWLDTQSAVAVADVHQNLIRTYHGFVSIGTPRTTVLDLNLSFPTRCGSSCGRFCFHVPSETVP